MPHRHQQERSQLKRQLAQVSQELAENEATGEFAVTSPIDGTATAVVAHIGQHVVDTKSLVSIIPNGQPLEAHLYVQSQAVGYLKSDAPVRLRYRAFPHHKYGMQLGNIISVAKASAPYEEISDFDPYHKGASEPLYLVTVRLAHQSIRGMRGEALYLRAGMLLEASVARETRRLYEWAFAPLYRLRAEL